MRTAIRRQRGASVVSTLVAVVAASVVQLSTAESADAAPRPDCGSTIRKSTGAVWTCTFADDFTGTALDRSKWLPIQTAANGYTLNYDCFLDDPSTVAVSSGTLRLTTRSTSATTCRSPYGSFTSRYASGMVSSYGRFSQAYGRFEIRAKMPSTKVAGVHGAWWLYPQTESYGGWPASGEIDIAEFYSQYPDRLIPMVHFATTTSAESRSSYTCTVADPTQFHTYAAEWTTSGLKVYYDGALCLSYTWTKATGLTLGKPFDKPFTLNLTQGIGQGTNAPTTATTLPATMEVDYVRVWA